METAAARRFFQAPYFAVAGASNDPSKFGHRIFVWYLAHNLPVTPLTPSSPSITTPHFSPTSSPPASYPTLPNPSALPNPKETALSIVTPPRVTLSLLKEARAAGIWGVFLQPGTYDDAVMEELKDEFWKSKWVGPGKESKYRGEGGWCVLVDGEDLLKTREEVSAGEEGKSRL